MVKNESMFGIILLLTSLTGIAVSVYTNQEYKSNEGTEFILMFLNNPRAGTPLQISMTTSIPDKHIMVRVYTPAWASSYIIDFNVTVQYGSKIVVNLPESLKMETADKDYKSVVVSADDAIVVFGSNIQDNTGDAFMVYPVSTLAKEYVALAYEADTMSYPSVLGCVATSDNTYVNVSLPDNITAEFDGFTSYTGTIPIQLTEYELFQIKATDLTGTMIQSNKDIACFSGNTFVRIQTLKTSSRDHIAEQLKPVSTWSNYFVVVVNPNIKLSLSGAGEVIRIVCLFDDTNISISIHSVNQSLSDAQNVTLNPRSFHEFFLSQGGSAIISSDSLISVGQFMISGGIDLDQGDPSMIITPAVDEYLGDYTFVFPAENLTETYTTGLVLVSECQTMDSIELDGIAINSSWTQVGNSGFYYTYLLIGDGFHRIKSVFGTFGGYLFGYGKREGYGTVFGRNMSTQKERKVTQVQGSLIESNFVLKGSDIILSSTPSSIGSTRSLQDCLKNCPTQETCEYVAFRKDVENSCLIYFASSSCPVFVNSTGYRLYKKTPN